MSDTPMFKPTDSHEWRRVDGSWELHFLGASDSFVRFADPAEEEFLDEITRLREENKDFERRIKEQLAGWGKDHNELERLREATLDKARLWELALMNPDTCVSELLACVRDEKAADARTDAARGSDHG